MNAPILPRTPPMSEAESISKEPRPLLIVVRQLSNCIVICLKMGVKVWDEFSIIFLVHSTQPRPDHMYFSLKTSSLILLACPRKTQVRISSTISSFMASPSPGFASAHFGKSHNPSVAILHIPHPEYDQGDLPLSNPSFPPLLAWRFVGVDQAVFYALDIERGEVSDTV